ncbi:MAG: hypothetical protein CMQ45_10795 [Gammaproteobacteria bacterium]|nr:hypothetical protein [Gammaproteobacteria bacterium]
METTILTFGYFVLDFQPGSRWQYCAATALDVACLNARVIPCHLFCLNHIGQHAPVLVTFIEFDSTVARAGKPLAPLTTPELQTLSPNCVPMANVANFMDQFFDGEENE